MKLEEMNAGTARTPTMMQQETNHAPRRPERRPRRTGDIRATSMQGDSQGLMTHGTPMLPRVTAPRAPPG